jgi:hypothetical protein
VTQTSKYGVEGGDAYKPGGLPPVFIGAAASLLIRLQNQKWNIDESKRWEWDSLHWLSIWHCKIGMYWEVGPSLWRFLDFIALPLEPPFSVCSISSIDGSPTNLIKMGLIFVYFCFLFHTALCWSNIDDFFPRCVWPRLALKLHLSRTHRRASPQDNLKKFDSLYKAMFIHPDTRYWQFTSKEKVNKYQHIELSKQEYTHFVLNVFDIYQDFSYHQEFNLKKRPSLTSSTSIHTTLTSAASESSSTSSASSYTSSSSTKSSSSKTSSSTALKWFSNERISAGHFLVRGMRLRKILFWNMFLRMRDSPK